MRPAVQGVRMGCAGKGRRAEGNLGPSCFFHTSATLVLFHWLQTMQALEANMPRQLERKKPQMTDKIAALRMLEPGITNAEIAERLDTSVFAINQHAQFLARTDGDPEKAIALRNDESRVAHAKMRKDARNWRDKTLREWHASGIPDPVAFSRPSEGGMYEKVAYILAKEPFMATAEIAIRLDSTPNCVSTIKGWLKKAGNDPVKAKEIRNANQREGVRRRKAEAEWQASGLDQ